MVNVLKATTTEAAFQNPLKMEPIYCHYLNKHLLAFACFLLISEEFYILKLHREPPTPQLRAFPTTYFPSGNQARRNRSGQGQHPAEYTSYGALEAARSRALRMWTKVQQMWVQTEFIF